MLPDGFACLSYSLVSDGLCLCPQLELLLEFLCVRASKTSPPNTFRSANIQHMDADQLKTVSVSGQENTFY